MTSRPPADTYIEPHWYTGKDKRRCVACGKVAYPDEATARERARQISVRVEMRAYLGSCGHWHVSRTKRSRGR